MIRPNRPTASTGMQARNTIETCGLMRNAKIHATMSMIGARMPTRMSIWYAFCTFVTSVVSLVMIEPVEKRSMFAKLNCCTFSNSSWRRFLAKPEEPMAANRPDRKPAHNDTTAQAIRMPPYFQMSGMDLPLMPLSIRIAMTVGMAISMTASTMTNSGESRLAVRYSRRDFANVLMTCALEGVVSVAVVVLMLPHLLSAAGVWCLA